MPPRRKVFRGNPDWTWCALQVSPQTPVVPVNCERLQKCPPQNESDQRCFREKLCVLSATIRSSTFQFRVNILSSISLRGRKHYQISGLMRLPAKRYHGTIMRDSSRFELGSGGELARRNSMYRRAEGGVGASRPMR